MTQKHSKSQFFPAPILLSILAVLSFSIFGCMSIDSAKQITGDCVSWWAGLDSATKADLGDDIKEIWDKWRKGIIGKPGDKKEPVADAPAGAQDAIPYESLVWNVGGYYPSKTTHSFVEGTFTSSSMSASIWSYGLTGLSNWGTFNGGHAGVVCAFKKRADGTYVGGKFDWTGDIGRPRPMQHINSYNDWNETYPMSKGEEWAFVIVQYQGNKRSPVVLGTVK